MPASSMGESEPRNADSDISPLNFLGTGSGL